MRTLIIDGSVFMYTPLFGTNSRETRRLKLKPDENGKIDFNLYKDIYEYTLYDNLSVMKNKFQVDEIVFAVDAQGYWRKQIWSGYKHSRKAGRDTSPIQWDKARVVMDDFINTLKVDSSIKVVEVDTAEADDVGFVLSEELSKRGHEVILYTVDHDWQYNLIHDNVSMFRLNVTTGKDLSKYVTMTPEEMQTERLDHVIGGDTGDYIKNVKAYTVFSPEFIEMYPKVNPADVWDKRHEVDIAFEEKHGISAYKHPRFGLKTYIKYCEKNSLTLDDFLKIDPLYRKNYDLNCILAFPEGIPKQLRADIITEYDSALTEANYGSLVEQFTEKGMFDLIGKITLL